jgi:hypothetical protein
MGLDHGLKSISIKAHTGFQGVLFPGVQFAIKALPNRISSSLCVRLRSRNNSCKPMGILGYDASFLGQRPVILQFKANSLGLREPPRNRIESEEPQ